MTQWMSVSRLSGKAFGLLTAGCWSPGEVGRQGVGGDQEYHQQGQLRWGQGRYGGLGEGWEEEVVFTGAEQVVEKESEGEPSYNLVKMVLIVL